jgi:hypothetical protein
MPSRREATDAAKQSAFWVLESLMSGAFNNPLSYLMAQSLDDEYVNLARAAFINEGQNMSPDDIRALIQRIIHDARGAALNATHLAERMT